SLPSTPAIKDSVGGVIAAGGTLTAEGFFDPFNVEFGMTVPTPILAFGPGAFSGTSFVGILPADQVTPFSLTKNVVITHTGAGATSFNNTLEVIPEPSTYLLFAVGILSIIGASYRQRKKA
ncbi:PEP-CTERM sorting domain-containing protein, partial [Candidatus Poribacteria bacterium]|nr:PEP-CTERM sorting domain-containing protein [Candidatus Poribacteria bacterium]